MTKELKQAIQEVIDMYYKDEEDHYSNCLFEDYGDEENSPFMWFENLDLGDREVWKEIIEKDYCSRHIYLSLLKLKLAL